MTIKDASDYLLNETKNPHEGLPQEVFDFVASIVPMVNVDLLVQNESGEILLAWRDDGKNLGWHIPGGILRFKETFAERLQKTAMAELGTKVEFDAEPIKINEIFMPYRHRGHFISFLFRCRLPKGFAVDNHAKNEKEEGYLKWHSKVPCNIVAGQKCYEALLIHLFNNEGK